MSKQTTIQIVTNPATKARMAELAKRNGTTVSRVAGQFMTKALDAAFEDDEFTVYIGRLQEVATAEGKPIVDPIALATFLRTSFGTMARFQRFVTYAPYGDERDYEEVPQ